LPVRKLAVSISAWMLESVTGSATSIVAALIAKLPRTGASPNRCRVLNVTAEQLVSISYRPGRGVACAAAELVASAAPVSSGSGLRAAIPFLLSMRVSCPSHARKVRRPGRHPKVDMLGETFPGRPGTKVPGRGMQAGCGTVSATMVLVPAATGGSLVALSVQVCGTHGQ
jgi:hypothetical protein